MKRIHLILAGVLLSAVTAAGAAGAAAGAQGRARAHADRTTVVDLRTTALGRILVNGAGHTLYVFTHDHGARNSCVAISECSETWPALQAHGAPKAGAGVRSSLLGTIRLRSGARQVTYAGHPLYLYSVDAGPGETSYVGEHAFGGAWYALSASGHVVR